MLQVALIWVHARRFIMVLFVRGTADGALELSATITLHVRTATRVAAAVSRFSNQAVRRYSNQAVHRFSNQPVLIRQPQQLAVLVEAASVAVALVVRPAVVVAALAEEAAVAVADVNHASIIILHKYIQIISNTHLFIIGI